MSAQESQQSQGQQIVQSTQFNDIIFQSSVSQYMQQHQSTNVSQSPYTTVISKNNPKPTLKNLIASRGKHQSANIVFNNNKTVNASYPTYSNTQRQSQQNLSGQALERICKYFIVFNVICYF